MNSDELKSVARAIVAGQKGVLAADESGPTIKKRFDSIKVESTEENRRRYRELLFTTDGIESAIGGVILYDETLRQATRDGTPSPSCCRVAASIPASKWTRAPRRWRCIPATKLPRVSMACANAWPNTSNWARSSPSGAR